MGRGRYFALNELRENVKVCKSFRPNLIILNDDTELLLDSEHEAQD